MKGDFMRKLIPLLGLAGLVLLVGCGVNPGKNPDQVDITGKVTLPGKTVTDVTFNLQPTGTGTQAFYPVKNGEFKGKATPGKYTYFISEGPSASAFKAIPEKYRSGSMDRQIDVDAGTPLNITLN
jgi:hypothetical protein